MEDDLNNLLFSIHKLQQEGDLPQILNIESQIINDYDDGAIYINIKMTHNEAKDFGYILCKDQNLDLKNYEKTFNYDEQTGIYKLAYKLKPLDVIPIFVSKEDED